MGIFLRGYMDIDLYFRQILNAFRDKILQLLPKYVTWNTCDVPLVGGLDPLNLFIKHYAPSMQQEAS